MKFILKLVCGGILFFAPGVFASPGSGGVENEKSERTTITIPLLLSDWVLLDKIRVADTVGDKIIPYYMVFEGSLGLAAKSGFEFTRVNDDLMVTGVEEELELVQQFFENPGAVIMRWLSSSR